MLMIMEMYNVHPIEAVASARNDRFVYARLPNRGALFGGIKLIEVGEDFPTLPAIKLHDA